MGPQATDSGPTISVIVPTYDRVALACRALESVRSQTTAPLEIVLVDDGSSDGTAAVVRERFPDVEVVCQTHAGVSAARNHGVRRSRGEWVAFLDSDDEWLPEKLELQLAAITESPDVGLCHCDEIWIRRGRRVNPRRKHRKQGGRIFRACLPMCVVSPSAALVPRHVLDQVGPFDERLSACEDYDMWLRICSKHAVAFVDRQLVVKHGGHDDQLSRTVWGLDRFRIVALEKVLRDPTLSSADREAAREVLEEKIAIFAAGARKRGRESEADYYERKRASL